jgi:hypothetical protein
MMIAKRGSFKTLVHFYQALEHHFTEESSSLVMADYYIRILLGIFWDTWQM